MTKQPAALKAVTRVVITVVFAAVFTLGPATSRAQDGPAAVKAAIAAMGTNTVKAIQYSGTGWNAATGQSFTPNDDWPKFQVTAYTRMLDYDARASREEWTRVQGNYPVRGGGGIPVYEWPAAVNGVWKQAFYVSGDYAWNVDGTTVSVAPRLSTSAAGLTPAIRQVDIWLSPHGFLKAAAAAKDLTAATVTIDGRPKTIVSFTTMDKYRLNGTIGADNLVERVQTWVPNAVFGDMIFEYEYCEYKDYNGVKFPTILHSYQGDAHLNPGRDYQEIRVSSVQVNPPGAALTIPDKVRQAPQPAGVRIVSSQLAPGTWRIAGEGHHSVAMEFKDFVAVVEAPQDEQRSLGVMAEVHKLIPNKPIRYVVNTHHHFDHSGGLRTYVAEGATVVTHAMNLDFYRNVFFSPAPRTLEPDLLSMRYPAFNGGTQSTRIEPVSDKFTISDGTRSLEVYTLQDVDESDMLVAYLPAEKILINADLYGPPAGNAPPPKATDGARQLADNIRRLKLDVDRHVGIHGDVGSNQVFLQVVAPKP